MRAQFKAEQTGNGWKMFKGGSAGFARSFNRAAEGALDAVANYLVDAYKRNIISRGTLVKSPFVENADLTIALKGHDRQLIDKGEMLGKFGKKKVKRNLIFVGWQPGKNADKASFLEIGGITRIGKRIVFVPGRPHRRPFLEHGGIRSTAQALFKTELNRRLKRRLR